MELSDRIFFTYRDWYPQYLREIVSQDFYDFTKHWQSSLADMELVEVAKKAMASGRYCPLIEDISLDDDTLYDAVTQIESE